MARARGRAAAVERGSSRGGPWSGGVSGEPLPALAGRRIWPCSQREPRQQRQAHEVVLAAYAEEWQAAEAACGTRSPARMQAHTAQGERSRLARSLGHAKIKKKTRSGGGGETAPIIFY